MADAGFNETEEVLAKMQKKVARTYKTAAEESKKKLKLFMREFKDEDAKKKAEVKSGKLTKEAYQKWRADKMLSGKRYQAMLDTLAADFANADNIAMSIVGDYMPEVYAINRNFGAFEVESGSMMDTSFTLYDRDTVQRLIKDNSIQLPKPKVDIPKDQQWNKRHIRQQITQGVLQGESIPDIARRLENVVGMDHAAAVRNARTATTGAQNLGRTDSYKRAREMGIKLHQEWLATLDGRTRHSHRLLDGVKIRVGDQYKFPNGCRYPGDPEGPPEEVYNCRCTLVAALDNFDQLDAPRNSKLGDMTYEEWKAGKKKKKKETKEGNDRIKEAIANAKDYSYEWHEKNSFSWDIWNGMTDDEKKGIKRYTGSWYEDMNNAMRAKDIYSEGEHIEKAIKDADRAMSHFKLPEDMKLYRGMGSENTLRRALGITEDELREAMADGSLVGMTFTESGFCSTAATMKKAWQKDVVLDIVAPKGTEGMYVDLVSSVPGEKEILLQNGMKFEILSYEKRIRTVEEGGSSWKPRPTLFLKVVITGLEKIPGL